MQAVLTKIRALEATLVEEKRKSRRSLVVLSGAYLVLIAWTLWDTQQVSDQIKSVSAPDQVAALAAHQVTAQLPRLQQDLAAHMQKSSPQIAARILQSAHRAIPDTSLNLKQQLGQAADHLGESLAPRIPAITAFLSSQLQDSMRTAAYASDAELSQALVTETVAVLENEFKLAMDPTLFSTLASIKLEIDQLVGKSDSLLSPEQRARKSALLNALALTERARVDQHSSLLAQGLRAILQASLPGDMFNGLDRPLQQ